jgi:leucine-rich repeat protein SHOC2
VTVYEFMKALLLIIILGIADVALAQRLMPTYNSNAIPVFEQKQDSIRYSGLLVTIRDLSSQPDTRPTMVVLDSLMDEEMVLRKKIIGYRLLFRSTRSFTTLADLREHRVKPADVTQLSVAEFAGPSLPVEVFECVNLKELELVNTYIRSLPSALNQLTHLESIYVYNNASGRPLKLGKNHHVRQLVLQGMTSQNLPRSYRRFARLDSLELSRNIGLRNFPRVAGNRNLVKLNLLENILTLNDLKRGNPSLQELNLSRNKIQRVPAAMGKFPALRKLILNANQIETVDPAIARLTRLENLGFYQNNLTAIPAGVLSLGNLRSIDMYYNKLTSLDPAIGGLKNLRVLYLSYNNLSELPASIGQLSGLQELYVHDNKLKSIPASINNLTRLRVLRINNNFLNVLPDALAPLQQLENLDVSRNYLYAFPDNWAKLPKLQVLGLMNNPWDNKEALEKIAETLRGKGVTCLYSAN